MNGIFINAFEPKETILSKEYQRALESYVEGLPSYAEFSFDLAHNPDQTISPNRCGLIPNVILFVNQTLSDLSGEIVNNLKSDSYKLSVYPCSEVDPCFDAVKLIVEEPAKQYQHQHVKAGLQKRYSSSCL